MLEAEDNDEVEVKDEMVGLTVEENRLSKAEENDEENDEVKPEDDFDKAGAQITKACSSASKSRFRLTWSTGSV